MRLEAVLAAIVAEYDVDAATATADQLQLVDVLVENGLLERRSGDAV